MLKPLALATVFVLIYSSIALANNDKHTPFNRHHNAGFSFAVIGDGPYGDDQEVAFDRMIKAINRDRSVDFVLHVGDIKSGGTTCSDERLMRRFEQLQRIKTALIYTPGDNEWTDCHRSNNGSWYPLERLDFIRDLFFPTPGWSTGQSPRRLTSQSGFKGFEPFVENSFFIAGRVAIATVHVVGSNNNLRPWSGFDASDSTEQPRADRINEYQKRNEAALAWLDYTFTRAKRHRAAGIFIAIHADPNFDTSADDPARDGFNPFLAKLFELSNQFDKPVVLGHGDSHLYRVDKPRVTPWYLNGDATGPEYNPQVPSLTRLEVFGDSDVHWVKVTANPKNKAVFNFSPQLVPANIRR